MIALRNPNIVLTPVPVNPPMAARIAWGVVVAAVYYVIQWCENNLIVPLIMKRTVGLSPSVTMVAMMVGVSFPTIVHPILGVILSIPTATVVALFLEDIREHRRAKLSA
jgi:predicted PurR-regulated permease PerM